MVLLSPRPDSSVPRISPSLLISGGLGGGNITFLFHLLDLMTTPAPSPKRGSDLQLHLEFTFLLLFSPLFNFSIPFKEQNVYFVS